MPSSLRNLDYVKSRTTFNCKIPAAELLSPKLSPTLSHSNSRDAFPDRSRANFLDVFAIEGSWRVRRGAVRSSIKSGIESKSWRDGSRDGRNWPSSFSCAVDPWLPRPFRWPDESLIFPEIYLIIARLTTSSFTSKGIECRQFPVSTLPFLRSARP